MRERRLSQSFLAWLEEYEPDAFVVLAVTRLRYAGEPNCHIPNMIAYWLGWTEKRVKAARRVLLDLGLIELVAPARGYRLALYRFTPGVADHTPLPAMPTMH